MGDPVGRVTDLRVFQCVGVRRSRGRGLAGRRCRAGDGHLGEHLVEVVRSWSELQFLDAIGCAQVAGEPGFLVLVITVIPGMHRDRNAKLSPVAILRSSRNGAAQYHR